MRSNRTIPEVNAGSMADIAFLLLIFFLVTTSIENDTGISKMLPQERQKSTVTIKNRNLLRISINPTNGLMVNEEITALEELKALTIKFLDNGGSLKGEDGFCDYCRGARQSEFSENPQQAIISLTTSRNSDYEFYVAVYNELMGAYNFLRNREGQKLFNQDYETLISAYNNAEEKRLDKALLKDKITSLRAKYPQKIVEPETINY